MSLIIGSEKHPPIRCLAIANSGQGKTTWVSNYISNQLGKQWAPPHVVIISKTWKSDPSIEALVKTCTTKKKNFKEQNCFDDVQQGTEFLDKLVLAQKHRKEELKKSVHQWVVLLDDMIGEKLLYSDRFTQLLSLGRHYGVSVFTLLQETRALSPKVLGQCNLLVVGRIANQDRLEDLLQQFNEGLGKTKKERRENVLQLFTTAMSKAERGFLLIRPHELSLRDRYLDLNWTPLLT